MTQTIDTAAPDIVRVPYEDLLDFVTDVFTHHGVPPERARAAAEGLCYGDLAGFASHGVVNLTRLYLPLLTSGRADPAADLVVTRDRGAAVAVDARRTLGLWAAGELMDLAIARANEHGVGLVAARDMTHIGCAGGHVLRAARAQMIGVIASNCGRQRIARPPGGGLPMLGTNPLGVAAPAGPHPPFVLDMSTTVVPTGKVRLAAREGSPAPEGWLYDDHGRPVTDPAAFDRGEAHLTWLGGRPETGVYKGYGLGLTVEVLAALLSGSGMGPEPEALDGDGRPSGRDDDIGMFVLAIKPGLLRDEESFTADAAALFGTLLNCPPLNPDAPVRYPGWHEAERAAHNASAGVPLPRSIHAELRDLAADLGLAAPFGGE
ncbi:malate dehydrogenase [Actinomadura rubrobrunea]|uniref:Malate dehydrogenase n=1 Tax=Actinomadura rubrobrunea TaxID=115335 RepID=A0A9W6PZT4_9ACTN|nr:Ldh family oxidoreductase [Actinomadura rubrobrunea]GLW66952.1 malate dehydrogenase [Actinomadura rubrobrunea]